MADIVNPIGGIKNAEDAREAAKRTVESAKALRDKQRFELQKTLEAITAVNPDGENFSDIAGMLALPDEHFEILAPIFLSQMERDFRDANTQMELVQMMNIRGVKVEDIRAEYAAICLQIDEQLGGAMSFAKRDFLKRLMGLTYNAMAEADGAAHKTILIPIEYCNPNAKMPTYAHLTDSGMDVYALEDITVAPGETKLVPTGIKVAIPAGYELQVRPKSGRCLKTKLRVANTPGTIDAGYRDEIGIIIDNIEPFIKFANIDENGRLYNIEFGSSYTIGKGEKFAQLVLAEVPKAIFYQVESVGEVANDGRNGGFGSTGVK